MMAGALFGLITLGINAASVGPTLVPGAGRLLSGVAVRTVIHPSPSFFGRVKLPVKVADGSMETTSPGLALFRAACRSCPGPTEMTVPVGATMDVSNVAGKVGRPAELATRGPLPPKRALCR